VKNEMGYIKASVYFKDLYIPNINRPYPQTIEIMSLTSEWQIANGGKGALFYSRIAVNDGKGRRVQ